MTEHALNHRFRRLKAQAVIIREGRARGFDMKHLLVEDTMPSSQDAVDKQSMLSLLFLYSPTTSSSSSS